MSPLFNAASLLVDVVFGLLALLFVLRVLLPWSGASFNNPVCQAVYRLSNPFLMPLRPWLRSWRRIDLAAVALAFLLMAVKANLLLGLARVPIKPLAVAVLAVAELLSLLLTLYFWVVLAVVVLSWVGRDAQHPLIPVLGRLADPVLRPFRRVLPAPGGLDLSPLLLILVLALLRILTVEPLRALAVQLARA